MNFRVAIRSTYPYVFALSIVLVIMREDFLSFIKLDRVRAVDIASAIIRTLEEFGLSLDGLRGQGYDGASTMSGQKTGVQARIKESSQKLV